LSGKAILKISLLVFILTCNLMMMKKSIDLQGRGC
jgi:hypothetical protein